MSTAFDTLAYAKKLKEAGFTEQQAEAQAEALRAVVDANLATKQDIAAVQRDIEMLRREIKEMEMNLRRDMKELEARVTLRLGGLMVAGIGVLAVPIKL
jgi:HEPN domain-containing protein